MRQTQLTYEEFIEASGRIAEKLSMVPKGDTPEFWTSEERIQ